jgi:hypothetical protein
VECCEHRNYVAIIFTTDEVDVNSFSPMNLSNNKISLFIVDGFGLEPFAVAFENESDRMRLNYVVREVVGYKPANSRLHAS